MILEVKTSSPEQSMLVAEKFASSVSAPCVISLVGDLGAGKTTFSKGFAKGLGVKEVVTSPTFAILNEYQGKTTKLYHFDLYRLSGLEEAHAMGFEEYFDLTRLDGIVLVEWASNTEGLIPMRHYEINIEKVSDNERKIKIILNGVVENEIKNYKYKK